MPRRESRSESNGALSLQLHADDPRQLRTCGGGSGISLPLTPDPDTRVDVYVMKTTVRFGFKLRTDCTVRFPQLGFVFRFGFDLGRSLLDYFGCLLRKAFLYRNVRKDPRKVGR